MESVTIIVLGYNSKSYLQDCFTSLQQMEGLADEIEILFVDNASDDGSAAWVREHFSSIHVLKNPTNLGFSGGNNVGARYARSDWIAFLNPDMRVAPDWLAAMLHAAQDPTVDCVASRIMNWDGSLVDFGGAAMNFYGYGMQEGVGAPVTESCTEDKYVLFPCGGAMLIRKKVFLTAGGFDEDYFAFFEDADLGWRLWILGYAVKYAGQAVVYHHHHGSWGQVPERNRQTLYERNTLATILKNYEDDTLQRVLPAALQLMSYRAFLTSGIEPDDHRPQGLYLLPRSPGFLERLWGAVTYYGHLTWETLWQEGPWALVVKSLKEIERRQEGRRERRAGQPGPLPFPMSVEQAGEGMALPDRTFAYFEAAQSILDQYDRIMEKRRAIQAARKRSDQEILHLFQKSLVPNYPDYEHLRALHVLSALWSLYDLFDDQATKK